MANLSNINNKFLVTTGGHVIIGSTSDYVPAGLQVSHGSGNGGILLENTGTTSDMLLNIHPLGLIWQRWLNGTYQANLMTLDYNGNLLIGVTSTYPQGDNTILKLYSPSVPRFYLQNTTTGSNTTDGSQIYVSGSDLYITNSESANTIFSTNSLERMRIDSSGVVSITNTGGAVLKLQAGTNNSASLRLINDAHDWDLNCQTSDKFAIFSHTDATERLVILPTSGNVGIGTASPDVLLQLRSNINTIPANTDFAMRSGKSFRFLGDGDGNADYGSYIEAPTKGIITIGTRWVSGDEGGLTVNRAKVGIGITNPGAQLDVVGPSNGSTILKLQRNGVGAYNYFVTDIGSGAQQLFCDAQQTDSGFVFRTRDSGNATITALYIAPSGNVGIGITNPQDKLHVNGDAIISSTKHGDFAVASIDTTGYAIATISASTNGQSALVEFIATGGAGAYYNVVYTCYNGAGNWYYTKNVVGSGGNIEVAETNGSGSSTLVFYFRSTSGVQGYTPRVMMKGMPYNLVTF